MADEITVKVVVDELDSLAKTPGLNLTKAQKDSLATNQAGARKALEAEDWKNFHKYIKNVIDILQKASVATGKISDKVKKLGEAQDILQKELSGLYKKRDELKGKITSSKGEGTIPKSVADEIFNKSAEKGKIFSSAKNPKELQDTSVILSRADKIIELLDGKSRSSLTNEMAREAGFRDKQSGLASLRLRDETQKFVKDTQAEIVVTDSEIAAKEAESVALSEEINKIATIAPEADKALEGLYKRLVEIAGIVNKGVSEKISTANAKDAASQPGLSMPKDTGQLSLGSGGSGLGKAFKQFTLYAVAVRMAKQALREAVQTVKELDKYLTEQAMVTGKTRKETYALVGTYQELALSCGATTKEIAQVTTEYMKQGKSTADALVLTEAAVKAAKVARVSVGDSVNYLTTALNGFQLEATEAMRVSDIFASVAAASATDYDELAIALSKVASQANLAGMSIEYTTALLTKGLETTREAPETMGTALKTIIARMREMSDYGETLEGDTDVNNVESQLAYVDIDLKDERGELRSTEEVLDDLGKKWDTLNKNQQAALARALAGTRQQSRLIALMDDYERVVELQEIAERSTGATSAQAGVYLEGMEASLNKIQVAWEKIIMSVTESEVIIGFFDIIGTALDYFGNLLSNPFFTGVALVAVVGTLMKIIGLKLQEQHIAKEVAKIEAEKNLVASKERLKALETEKKLQIDKLKQSAAELKKEVEKTAELKKQNIIKQNEGKDPATYQEQLDAVDREAKEQMGKIEEDTQEQIEATNKAYDEQIKLQKEVIIHNEDQLNTVSQARTAWLGYANAIKSIGQGVVGIIKGIGETAKKMKTHSQSMSASSIPMIGWIISLIIEGGALLAAIVSGVTAMISMISQWIGSLGNSADNASKEVNTLSNEIYKLNETANAVANVTSQFDKLDNKVIKTKEDIAEMNSLLDSAKDSLSSELEEDGKGNTKEGTSQQDFYDKLQTNTERRKYLEKVEEEARAEANKLRQKQLKYVNNLSKRQQEILLDDDTTNSTYLETQSAIRATVNNKIYETIDALKEEGTYTEEKLRNTEDLTTAIVDQLKAVEALNYANNPEDMKQLVAALADLDDTHIFMDESQSIVDRVKAFEELRNELGEGTAAFKAFTAAFSEWEDFAELDEQILQFIDATGLSIDAINELYAGYEKLQKEGVKITKEQYQNALEDAMYLMEDDLSNFEETISAAFDGIVLKGKGFEDEWNALISAIGDTFAVAILDMGQNMEKFENTINNFYEKSANWANMKESEKMEFIADNADLFSGEGGDDLLKAFESGNYDLIEAALAQQMEDETEKRLAEVRRTLAVEEARVGEDRNEAYIASLKEYEKYLEDGNDLYKASLELRLEQEKSQIDEYKSYLEDQQEALEESLNKRKEAYEKYFDDIDQQEEKQDYEDEANLLVTNLARLGSSTNADAKNKQADLEQQLKELEEERLETLREQAREAVLEKIDKDVEEINEKFDKLLSSNEALLAALTGELDNPTEFLASLLSNKLDSGATTLEMQDYINELKGIYGSVLGNEVFDNINVEQNNGQTILNINNEEILLSEGEQQSIYAAIVAALQQIGKS